MAVANQTPYKEYIGNGTTKIFPLEFDCDDADHLIVKVNDIEVPAVNNWTLNTNTGSVVFAIAPTSQSKIILQRDTPLLRSTDYQTYNNSLRPQPVNKDFDKIWLKLQELGVTNWLTDTDIKNLSAYVNSLNEETRDDFFNKLGNLEQNTNAMLQEAIKNGAVSALAITTVSTVDELEALSVWDGRTVYVKNIGTFEYKTSQNAWQVSFNKAEFMIDESGQSQQEINNQIGAKLDSYYESSFSFGKRSKTTIKSKVNGVLSVDVERDGMPLAQSVTVPYVTTMQAYHSGKGEPFKQLMLPSDGFEDFNHSPSIVMGYDENDNLTPVMKGTNAAVGFDEFLRETEDQTALLTLRSFYSQSIKLPKNTDNTLSKYIKLVDINAGSLIYDVQFSATVAGSWDRERVASETTISVSNYQSIDWANASSYTADKWGTLLKSSRRGRLVIV
ncbi:hypothetical protein PX669_07245 [Acinetobacter soli]|nr:hypothetical protein PX669_07245 [Acinetobacter soli]